MKTKLLLLVAIALLETNGRGANSFNNIASKNQYSIVAKSLSNDDHASSSLFKISPKTDYMVNVKQDIRNAVFLEIDFAELAKINEMKSSQLTLTIPVSKNGEVTFSLHKAKILTDNFSIITGESEKVNYTPGLYYQGTVSGVAPSLVACSMFDNSMMGVFSYNNENYVLGLWNDKSNINNTIYILYKDSDVMFPRGFKCGTDELPVRSSGNGNSGNLLSNQCIKIYFECDYQMFLDKGSVSAVGNYVTGMFNVVNALYNVEALSTEISQIYVWSATDPYISGTNSTDLLNSFQAYRTTFNGNVAHFLTTRNLGAGGLAYLDVICDPAYAYGMSNIDNTYAAYPNFSWTTECVTHELGHNFGSNHTHWCGWTGGAIDDCYATEGGCSPGPTPANGGTIMSYCHLTSTGILLTNGFGPQPGNKIRASYNAASCLTVCASPPVPDFTASPTSSCAAPLTVTFTDQTLASPTAWEWDIDNNGTTDYTTQSPTHTYSSAGTYSVKLTAYNINGNTSITKTNYIIVGSAALPFSENFENAIFPPGGWSDTQTPVDTKTWTRNTTAAGNGASTACASIDFFNYATTGGEKDNLISKPVSLIGVNNAKLTFKLAYRNYQNPANYDTLKVFVSTNCGSTYGAAVYTKSGTALATSGVLSTEFTPTVSGDWRTDTISLNSFTGNNIVVRFEGTNKYGNNLYLDDINITGSNVLAPVTNFTASDTTICVGDCINFTDQSTNSPTLRTWTFTGAATTSSSLQNPTNICYNTQGAFNVSLLANNSGGSNTKIKTGYIVVSPLPATPTINQSGNILTSSAAVSYQWNLAGSAISGATSISYTATASGTYTVVIKDANGCSATSNPVTLTITGVDDIAGNGAIVTVYPNPFSTSAIIGIQTTDAIQTSEMNFILYDLVGKEVMRKDNMNGETRIFREQLSDGLYFYKVFYKQQLLGKGKVVIQ